ADPLMTEFHEGIQKSFRYLQKDKEQLFRAETLRTIEALHILRRTGDIPRDLRQIDRVLKQMGYLLSHAQKEEIIQKEDVVISDRFAIVLQAERIYIAPYLRMTMPKHFKEACRLAKIPQKIRPYLYSLEVDPSEI
ncbi:MAG: tRNA lysidine(34) synthetase TilS, partial [Sulfurospirillum sp.]